MDSVQSPHATRTNKLKRDSMNNVVASSDEDRAHPVVKLTKYYKNRYTDSPASDNEVQQTRKRIQKLSHHRSMGNINNDYIANDFDANLNNLQNSISNVDLSLHKHEIKKYETLQIPIVGYEVMEERARFTIYKLKIEDDKRDQSWLVFRRYTDFVRLYSRIKTEQPNLMLPLPGKRWFKDNFDPSFLEDRVQGLQVFINAILKKLPNHPVVREFFCLDEPPQVFSYQPEVQAVYGALEDSICTMKMQLKQKDATIMHLQNRVAQLEEKINNCSNCSTNS